MVVQFRDHEFDTLDAGGHLDRVSALHRHGAHQAEVASAMRDRGFKWSQTTVWKVESGERPLRFTEAAGLADALGTESIVFTMGTHTALVEQYATKQERLELKAVEAIGKYLRGQYELAACADFADDEAGPLPEGTHFRVRDLLTRTVERIGQEQRIAIRHETASKEELRKQHVSLDEKDVLKQDLYLPANEDLYAIERDGRYDQMLDASWGDADGER
jgi:hypothetical protein